MVITTRVSAVLSSAHFAKLHSYARTNKVDARQVVAGVIEAWLDGKAPSEFEAKPERYTHESRLLQDIRGMFLELGPQTIGQLESCGRSTLAIRLAVKQLLENGEIVREEAEHVPGKLGRAPFLYVPLPSKMRLAAERYEASK